MHTHEAHRWLLAANNEKATLTYEPSADTPVVNTGDAFASPKLYRNASGRGPGVVLEPQAVGEETRAHAEREREEEDAWRLLSPPALGAPGEEGS